MSYWGGLDIGSLSCDVVILDDERRLVASEIVPTGARSGAAIERALAAATDRLGVTPGDLAALVATGYGRERVVARTATVTEITCHARGAAHLFPGTQLVLDVGGQDCKAIRLDDEGRVLEFAMNDKCAAGTGRFFEVMARALEIDLDDLGPLALTADRRLTLSSLCTVFAESEVVSLVARDEAAANIAAGLCRAAAERLASLARRVGLAEPVTMTSGGACNVGLRAAVEELLGVGLQAPAEPQLVGALGAALLGWEAAHG